MKLVHSILFVIPLLAFSPSVLAGDTASIDILGFSPDGATFAFEEYGVEDGSGFPYANRYYIDTAKDRFLSGTPIRVTIEKDGAGVLDARARAESEARSIISDRVLFENRGFTAGWNAVTETSADPTRMTINPRPVFPPIDEPVSVRLSEVPMPGGAECYGMGEPVGFRLTTDSGGSDRVIHEDKSIPRSRGCPTGYRLSGIQTFYPPNGTPVFAVIIAVEKIGFEGPDHRFIAVTGRL